MRTVVILLLLSSTAHAFEIVDASPRTAEIEADLATAANLTRDPGSVQFRKLRPSDHPKKGICGQMNAKNGFGAYVGFRSFYAKAGEDPIIEDDPGEITYDLTHMTLGIMGCN